MEMVSRINDSRQAVVGGQMPQLCAPPRLFPSYSVRWDHRSWEIRKGGKHAVPCKLLKETK